MTVADVLVGARELIERGWTQRAYARDISGRKVDELADQAVEFCLLGALRRASGRGHPADTPVWFLEASVQCYEQARLELLWPSLLLWHDQDGRTPADVMEFLDRVIARVA